MLNPLLIKVWLMMVAGEEPLLNPLICNDEPVAVQVNKVPVTFEVSVMPVDWVLHCDFDKGLFERLGVG